MFRMKRIFILAFLLIGLSASLIYLYSLGANAQAAPAPASAADASALSDYRLLAWNDLGMHCYNHDFADLAVLPPYNTLWAQVVKAGDPPQIVTSGIVVSYEFPNNTTSVTKVNFWIYAQQLFGLSSPLPPDIGLKGKGLSGTMDLANDHFIAEGIPLTEYSDGSTIPDPYQLALITVKDSTTGVTLAQERVVAPVSSEMMCVNCHSDDGDATIESGITPTGKVETNILAVHDKESMEDYPSQYPDALMNINSRPVLCAKCHSSNALAAPGIPGIPSLSNAMHSKHSGLDDITPDTNGCYNCHPGPQTQCLRDVMSQQFNFSCINCHGQISKVAQNPNPWLNEPRCDTCHGLNAQQNQALYRHSTGHGGLYCESCHDSTHAIAPSREPNDALKFIDLQGHAGTLGGTGDCSVCHTATPSGGFLHGTVMDPIMIYVPVVVK